MTLMALLSMIMDGPAAAVIGLIGLRVSPHFDRPWTAKSVVAFWNKHWVRAAPRSLCALVALVPWSLLLARSLWVHSFWFRSAQCTSAAQWEACVIFRCCRAWCSHAWRHAASYMCANRGC